jgi:hypothetical protein
VCPINEPQYSAQLEDVFMGVLSDCVNDGEVSGNCILTEELKALNDLVEGMRVDLLQTSTLVTYIKNYLKKM